MSADSKHVEQAAAPVPDPVELEKRTEYFDGSEDYTEYLSSPAGEARLLVKTEDKHIGRSIFMKQGRGDIKVLGRCVMTIRALLGPKMVAERTFIDVGANIGTTTITALVSHPFAHAVAIEPEPENFKTLRLNLVLNGVDGRATALLAAASSVVGELDLVVSPSRSGRHWIATDQRMLSSAKDGEIVIKVPTVTLDSLVEVGALDPDSVGLLWIDAENHEGQILAGASEIVSRGVPLIFEWDPQGLDKRGDPGTIQEIASKHYTHFVDMRRSGDSSKGFSLHSAGELEDYVPTGPDGDPHFTEILVLRLTKEQAQGAEDAMRTEKARLVRASGKQRKVVADDKNLHTGERLLEELTRLDERTRSAPDAAAKAKPPKDMERARIEKNLAAVTKQSEKKGQKPKPKPRKKA